MINATQHAISVLNIETKEIDVILPSGHEIRLVSSKSEPLEKSKYEYRSSPKYIGIDLDNIVIPNEECDLFVSALVGEWVANFPGSIPDHVRVIGADWGKDEETGKSRMIRDNEGRPKFTCGFVVFRDRVQRKKTKTELE